MSCRKCGSQEQTTRFGPDIVQACTRCHGLTIDPVIDPSIPTVDEHLDALRAEIQAVREEHEKTETTRIRIDKVGADPGGTHVEGQLVGGPTTGLTRGSQLEGWISMDQDPVNVRVLQKSRSHVICIVEAKGWRQLRPGTIVHMRPVGDATVIRNLHKSFTVVTRQCDLRGILQPTTLPSLQERDVAVDGLAKGQAEALRKFAGLDEGGLLMIHGPPGTGKTTVIANGVAAAVKAGLKVLVTSHTHVAIDNALEKTLRVAPELALQTARLGDTSRVAAPMSDVQKNVQDYQMEPEEEDAIGLFANLQQRHGLIGMTLDALSRAIWFAADQDQNLDPFDLVVVDEAGMNGFPKTALAWALGKRLVLVGDPLQLPPIIRARGYRENQDHARSSFEVLQRQRRDLSVLLDTQFRCHPDIYSWSQDAIYRGDVQSGIDGTNRERVQISGIDLPPVTWLTPSEENPKREGTSWVNEPHQRIALAIFLDLVKQGVPAHEIGYITPFKAQAVGLRSMIEETPRLSRLIGLTCATVDAFQGNERRVILYDLTTPWPRKPHEDPRRLNVSLTRAEQTLLILGRRNFVQDDRNPYHASLQRWATATPMQSPDPWS